ncbi:MAG: ion transporter [Akkermansiaceae bacterium]|nr:ion transporter [Akkermansiaceae bacterium]
MSLFKQYCYNISNNRVFELFIIAVILINSLLIGVETYTVNPTITLIQNIILGIFTVEILMRYVAAPDNKTFFTGGWNIFDLSLVLIGYIPEELMPNASMAMAFRVLRVFRVLRLLRTCKEIKLIISVLVKSLSALFYNLMFYCIFLYLFAIIGVSVFKLPQEDTLPPAEQVQYTEYINNAPHAPGNAADPYGTLDESMFTLFRVMTGDDWSDVRYNLITASEYGVVKVSPTFITVYHVLWFVISAFLLLNLVVGAILNNYQVVMDSIKKEEKEEESA